MSVQITTAFVQGYRANVEHLAQQKGSRLRGSVRVESINSKRDFFEQIGSVEVRWRTSRHSDTPIMDTPHSRRSVTTRTAEYGDLIDRADRIRLLIDPAGPYTEAAAFAMGRAMDEAILDAATGTAYTGEDGSTSTSYDSNMTVDVQVVDPGVSAADTGLNIAKLIAAKKNLDQADVDPDLPRFIAVNGRQLSSLLKTTQVTSADYNSVRALVGGQIDTFLGFKFLMTNRIRTDANGDDKVVYWAKPGILLAIGQDITAKISERNDKSHSTQVYVAMDVGATRMQENMVGYIECDVGASPTTDA